MMFVALDIVQDEHFPRGRGEALERRIEIHAEVAAAPCRRHPLQRVLAVADEAVPQRAERAKALDNHIDREAVEPRGEGGVAAKRAELLPGAHEHVLRQLVGGIRSRHAAGQPVHPRDMPRINAFERNRIAASRECDIGVSRRLGRRRPPFRGHHPPRHWMNWTSERFGNLRTHEPTNVYCVGLPKSTRGTFWASGGALNSGYSLKPKMPAVTLAGNWRRAVLYS